MMIWETRLELSVYIFSDSLIVTKIARLEARNLATDLEINC